MNIRPPLQEAVGESWTQGWTAFMTQLFQAVGWLQSWSYKFTIDFASVPANSESAGQAVTISGVRQGDSVHVTPFSNTVGMTYKALVTADDTVTIYAINYTTGAVNPASMLYRVVVIQN